MHLVRPTIAAALLLPAALLPPPASGAAPCQAASADRPAQVVELYTSEGCSSCPPADRWLSGLRPEPGVVALAFHVDYWDRLGWADRFASPAFTERQHEQQRSSGARFVYTPQVLVNGRDWRGWPGALPGASAAPVRLRLQMERDEVTADVTPLAASPAASAALAGYWAAVEDGHVSRVAAGENAGSVLHHDHVVRRYQPIARWTGTQPRQFSWRLPAEAVQPGIHRRIAFVVTDADSGRPVQALELSCMPG